MESLCVNVTPFRDKRHLRKSSTQGERRYFTVGLRIAGHRAAGIFIVFLKGTEVLGSTRRARFTRAALRHANIRDNKGPSLGTIQVKRSHLRTPYAMKFEDRSQEETEGQERCARRDAWRLTKNIYTLKETDKIAFFSPSNVLTKQETTVYVRELDLFVTIMLLPLGKLCEGHGYTYHWTSDQKPQLIKMVHV